MPNQERGGARFNVQTERPGVGRTAVADRVVTPNASTVAPSIPRPEVKVEPKPQRIGKRAGIALAGLAALGAIETTGAVITEQTNNQPLSAHTIPADLAWPWNLGKSAVEDIKGFFNRNKTTSYEGSLAPKESASWWKELSTEEIQKLAEIPSINIIEKDISKINPVLQQKATKAGYEIIYQGDPNDTTGRTVVTKGRQSGSKDWTYEDQGFGRAGGKVRGIFQTWVPDPEDPTQKDHIYASLKNPDSGENYIVRIELQPFNPNSPIRPTWFAVDDLNNGPSMIREASKAAGFDLSSEQIPTNQDPPDKKWKKPSEFPTFNDLIRRKNLDLTDLARPGDYVIVGMQIAGVNETEGKHIYKIDDMGIARAGEVVVRRFGGEAQWKSKLPKQ